MTIGVKSDDDTEPPVWNIPEDIVVNTDPGLATTVVNYVATATDNVGVASSNCYPASGSLFIDGTRVVTCTATDEAGNVGTATFTVTVLDQEPPVITVPSALQLSLQPGQSTA